MARVRKQGNLPHICRIDQPHNHTHGWYLRVPLGSGGTERFVRFFSDSKHGGKEGALRRALEVRGFALNQEAV